MTSDLVLRQYTPSDADQVLVVCASVLEAHGWEFIDKVLSDQDITDSFLGITADYQATGGEFLVGFRADEIIATAGSNHRTQRRPK